MASCCLERGGSALECRTLDGVRAQVRIPFPGVSKLGLFCCLHSLSCINEYLTIDNKEM